MAVREAQEEMLGAILAHSPVGMALLTADDLTYEYLNAAYQSISPDKPMLGRRYADVWPEVADTIVPLVREVAETGRPWIGENLPLEIHRVPGQAKELVYFTFVISRLELADEPHILVTVYEVTRQVEARRRIESEGALLQAVLQAMNEAVIISDAEANVLDMNAEALRLTGFENAEQVRRNLKAWPEYELQTLEGELLAVDDWPLGRVTRGEDFTNLVLRVLNRSSGEQRVWRYSGSPVFDDSQLVRTVLTFTDMTEEHKAQEELRESEQRFRSVLENSLDAAYRRDLRTDAYDYLSPVIEQITGFSPDEFATLLLEEVLDRIHPDDVHLVKEALPDALQTGRLTVEYRFRRKDDRYVWLADNAAVVKDAEGKPLYLSGVVRDSTSRKQLEEHAERDHRRLRTLLDTLPVAVFISDAQGGLIYTNEQVTELWGELPETPSMDEYGVYKAWRTDTGERLRTEDWSGARALKGEKVLGEVLEIERFDGQHATILNSSVPIADEQGAVAGQVTIEQDITERRRLEQERDESLRRLQEERRELDSERQRLRESLETTRRWLEAADAVASSLKLEDVATAFAEQATRFTGATRVLIEVFEPGLDGLTIVHSRGELAPPSGTFLRADQISDAFREVIRSGGSHLVDAEDAQATEDIKQLRTRLKYRYYIVVPLRAREQTIGALVLDEPGDRHEFTSRHVTFLEGLAPQAAMAIQNAQLLDAQREAARYSEALNEVDAEISSTLDVDQIMGLVLERVARTIGADVGVVYVPVQGEWEARYHWQAPSWLQGRVVQAQDIPYSAQAAQERNATLFLEPATHAGWEESIACRLNARQVLDAPLMLGSDQAGDLTVYKLGAGDFTEADRDFLHKTSAAVSLALQNARRYQREREIADTLQEALLTLPAEVPGLELAHAYRSAAEVARVGGDFYDTFRISDDVIGIVVGDVAGKGLEASVLTALAKNAIRAHATEKGAVPGHVLALTNDLVFNQTQGESFITIFLGVLDVHSGRLTYSSAGHTTGAVIKSEGGILQLHSTGPVLAAFPGLSFGEAVAQVDLDDSLFLYTDGLTEARCDDELFGEERLFDFLARRTAVTAGRAVRGALDQVLAFAGGHLTDDLAVLCVRRLAGNEESSSPEMIAL